MIRMTFTLIFVFLLTMFVFPQSDIMQETVRLTRESLIREGLVILEEHSIELNAGETIMLPERIFTERTEYIALLLTENCESCLPEIFLDIKGKNTDLGQQVKRAEGIAIVYALIYLDRKRSGKLIGKIESTLTHHACLMLISQ
jgi:hypothetical protein